MSAASALPALAPNDEGRVVTERVNALIRWFNRPDLFVPSAAADTGSSTAYVMAPSTDIRVYEVNQVFIFKAANANTTATPTLNVNSLGAGTITRLNGSALSIGDIPANAFIPVIVTSTTPTFALLYQPAATATQTYLTAADVALSNVANFFNGPNTGSIGLSGQVWKITAKASIKDTAGAAGIVVQIHDGTNGIESATTTTGGAAFEEVLTFSKIVTLTAATTFTLQAKDVSSVSGVLMKTGASGVTNTATSITAERLS